MTRRRAGAAVYDSLMAVSGWRHAQAAFAAGVSGSVLDVGCGTAHMGELVGPRYTGVDASMAMLVRAGTARVICADAAALPFGDEAFDVVISTAFLGLLHPAGRAPVLREMARVCRREMRLLEPLDPLNPVRRAVALSRYPLRLLELADAGLQVRVAGPAVFTGVYTPLVARPCG